ncbi:hypothetical protein [Falsihalocynthiibacter arcticus]|uniref:hypothetical protein n=1 Tax=Falsihalocynthiibacter arcticus TaxID=1579316 RepID=UPI0030015C4C
MAVCKVMINRDRGAARLVVESLNLRLLADVARKRQGRGSGEGARAPLGFAQPRRRLEVITAASWVPAPISTTTDGLAPTDSARKRAALLGLVRVSNPVTPLGYTTARRALPPLLAGLDPEDPRRRAALILADSVERVGALKGGDLTGGSAGGDISGGVNDGGVTTRVKHAARLRYIEALANGEPISGAHGAAKRGHALVVLTVRRQRSGARNITAMALLEQICIEGRDMREILQGFGWSAHSSQRKALGIVALDLLETIAGGLNL